MFDFKEETLLQGVICCGLREILHHFGLSCYHRPNLANIIREGGGVGVNYWY
jgi:hypothetical protein